MNLRPLPHALHTVDNDPVARRQAVLDDAQAVGFLADLDRAVRASARHVGAAIEACGSAGGVSDELEMGLFVAGSTGAWQPYYLPPTPWQYVASGEVRAEEVGPEGVRRTIVRRESMQA